MAEELYRSQLSYGPYGHRICTPVSCAVASQFLMRQALPNAAAVDYIMRTSYALYVQCFASTGKDMMLLEVQRYIPKAIERKEVAGMLHSELAAAMPVEDICIKPLHVLLEEVMTHEEPPWSLVVTFQGHTVCFLREGARLFLFDPLPASLLDVSDSWKRWLQAKTATAEYAGLLLFLKGAAACECSI